MKNRFFCILKVTEEDMDPYQNVTDRNTGICSVQHSQKIKDFSRKYNFFKKLNLQNILPCRTQTFPFNCVADPDPSDPYVFGSPGSFYHQAKLLRKPLIPTVL
jgi:hypothetical protein